VSVRDKLRGITGPALQRLQCDRAVRRYAGRGWAAYGAYQNLGLAASAAQVLNIEYRSSHCRPEGYKWPLSVDLTKSANRLVDEADMGSSFISLVGVVATIDWTWHGRVGRCWTCRLQRSVER
jgi:hypothetical protein